MNNKSLAFIWICSFSFFVIGCASPRYQMVDEPLQKSHDIYYEYMDTQLEYSSWMEVHTGDLEQKEPKEMVDSLRIVLDSLKFVKIRYEEETERAFSNWEGEVRRLEVDKDFAEKHRDETDSRIKKQLKKRVLEVMK